MQWIKYGQYYSVELSRSSWKISVTSCAIISEFERHIHAKMHSASVVLCFSCVVLRLMSDKLEGKLLEKIYKINKDFHSIAPKGWRLTILYESSAKTHIPSSACFYKYPPQLVFIWWNDWYVGLLSFHKGLICYSTDKRLLQASGHFKKNLGCWFLWIPKLHQRIFGAEKS